MLVHRSKQTIFTTLFSRILSLWLHVVVLINTVNYMMLLKKIVFLFKYHDRILDQTVVGPQGNKIHYCDVSLQYLLSHDVCV